MLEAAARGDTGTTDTLAGACTLSVTPPALRAIGSGAMSTHVVSLPSMTRCTRSQVVYGMRRRAAVGTSAMSSTTTGHTPDCSTRFSALSARSSVRSTMVPGPSTVRTPGSHTGSTAPAVLEMACPRIHSSRDKSMPQAVADVGSNRSNVSTSATVSPRRVAAAIHCHTSVVRPDDAGPTTSDNCPAGSPPCR